MFRLVRWLFSTLLLFILIWFIVTIPIGKYTLWQHAKRIAGTKEAHDLANGATSAAKNAATRVEKEVKEATKPQTP